MSYTGTEIFNMAVAIIDELSETGAVSDAQVKEYKYRAPYLLDMWQREVARILKTVSFARHPAENLLGERFGTVEHSSGDKTYEAAGHAGSAAFFIDSDADVYVEEYSGGAWASVSGYYSKDAGTETPFSGAISLTGLSGPAKIKCRFSATGEKVRLRFSGDYYYLFYAFALFEAAYASCGKVPEYGEYVRYDMPADFSDISEIVEEAPRAGLFHRWENLKDLYINYGFDGVLKITYKAAPNKIAALAQTLEADEETAASGAYYLAMHFALSDQNDEVTALCRSKFGELKAQSAKERPRAPSAIRDVYGIGDIR